MSDSYSYIYSNASKWGPLRYNFDEIEYTVGEIQCPISDNKNVNKNKTIFKNKIIHENKIVIDGNRTSIYVRGDKTVVTYNSETEGIDQYDRALGIWLAILKHILYSEVGRKHLWTWFCENVNFETLTAKKIMDYIQAYRGKELLEWYRNFVLTAHKEGKVFENCKKKKKGETK